ncbi:MAG: PQQ-binding-like beta-propeller repeat protein [Pseudomonadota bacterium]
MIDFPNWARLSRHLTLALLLAFVSACSSGPIGAVTGIFGGGDDEEDENAPEDDDRISILALDEQLKADPRYAGAPISIPPSYVNASWPQPGGEADHTLHHIAASLEFEIDWRVDIGKASAKRARLTAPPIVVSDRVFVIDAETTVSAFEAATGDLIWEAELAPKIEERFRIRDFLRGPEPSQIGFGGGVAFDDGRIFVTSGFGFVAALDAITGEELWRVQTTNPVRTPPTAYRGRVYLATNTNEFLALEQETGEKAWTFQSFEEAARFLSSSSPAAAGDLVVAPFSSGELVAFLADNGRAVWNETLARQSRLTALSSLNDIAGSPVIDRGLVYVVSHGGQLEAIDIRSGEPVWQTSLASLQMPWVAGDFLFVVSVEGELACLSRSDGGIIWVSQLTRYKNEKKRKGRITWAGPVLAGDHLVLVSSDKEIIKVSPQTGEIVATEKIPEGSVIAPVVAGEKVFVLTENGKLIAMR